MKDNIIFPSSGFLCLEKIDYLQDLVISNHLFRVELIDFLRFCDNVTGVISVAIEGEEKDRIVVVGEGVDSATLTHCLRKKVGHANLVSIEEVKPKEKEEKKERKLKMINQKPVQWTTCCQEPQLFITTIDCPEQPICSIM